jgi:hypothetical protein
VIRRTAVSLGRSSDSKGDVDVDLAKAPTPPPAAAAAGAAGTAAAAAGGAGAGGGVRSVSRLQAQLSLGLDGVWSIRNTGRAPLAVNGRKVRQRAYRPWLALAGAKSARLEMGGLKDSCNRDGQGLSYCTVIASSVSALSAGNSAHAVCCCYCWHVHCCCCCCCRLCAVLLSSCRT